MKMAPFALCLLLMSVVNGAPSDSYLNAYKLTHGLNQHIENRPTGEKVLFVDATTDQHIDVHPVYVQEAHDAKVESFHAEDAAHAAHSDHVDVEHHYEPEYHEHFVDEKDTGSSAPGYNVGQVSEGLGSYGTPASSYGPPSAGLPTYGPPAPVYPKKLSSGPVYGPPSPVYSLPSPVYAPPSPVYSPPTHHIGVYGPPHHKLPPLVAHEYYEPDPHPVIPDFLHNLVTPHAFLGILDKIKLFKLDLFTIGKLILKFFILKKFLTFFTILFLLLVIPSLKHKAKESTGVMSAVVNGLGMGSDETEAEDDDDEDDDESRSKRRGARMFIDKATDGINALTSHVLTTIENFEQKFSNKNLDQLPSTINATDFDKLSETENATDCQTNATSDYCKSQSVVDKIKTIMPARDDAEIIHRTKATQETTKDSGTKRLLTTTINAHTVNLTSKTQLKSEISSSLKNNDEKNIEHKTR